MPDDNLTAVLEEWRAAERAATEGPWALISDSCDCDDGICGHGSFPYAIRTPRPSTERANGEHPHYDYEHSEVSDLAMEDAEFIVTARDAVPRLLALADAARKLAGEWTQKVSALDAAAEKVAAEDPFAPGTGMKQARSAAYAECAGRLEMAISRALLGEEAPMT